jgi:hypothetical protein
MCPDLGSSWRPPAGESQILLGRVRGGHLHLYPRPGRRQPRRYFAVERREGGRLSQVELVSGAELDGVLLDGVVLDGVLGVC